MKTNTVVASIFCSVVLASTSLFVSCNKTHNPILNDIKLNEAKTTVAQLPTEDVVINEFAPAFEKAYQAYSLVPKGVLEAIAFTNTQFENIVPEAEVQGCTERPATYGIMGLVLDGKNYFRNNLTLVAAEANTTVTALLQTPENQLLGYAKAYTAIKQQLNITSNAPEAQIPVLVALSELPNETTDLTQNYALAAHIYAVLSFLNNTSNQINYNFTCPPVDMIRVFGASNYSVLSASYITLGTKNITTAGGVNFRGGNGGINGALSSNYGPAILNLAASCNYNKRTKSATAVVIHVTQGSYASAISWFKNCNSGVSAHYVIRSFDGQITQMVSESNKAWHVGINNGFTIGIEHEGFVNKASWFTNNMYGSSALLVRDICGSGYGITKASCYGGSSCGGGSNACGLSGTFKIKGHQHYPNQSHTDPGINWNWAKYKALI